MTIANHCLLETEKLMSDLDRQATGAPEPPEPPSESFACRGCGKNTMQFEDGGWEHEANCLALKLSSALKFVDYIAKRYEEGWDEPITERFYNEAKALLGGVVESRLVADLESFILNGNRKPGDPEPAGLMGSGVERPATVACCSLLPGHAGPCYR
jgi:hypothetical protein